MKSVSIEILNSFNDFFILILVEINRHEVTVYPDDDHKPPVGEELNLPARITLFGVYPVDRTTQEEIKDIERIKAANYNDHLREITKKFDGEFINYEMKDGSWTFMVKNKKH
jgi:nuclear pore complex protein Nup98-Nup96